MRHYVRGRKLKRTSSHRKAMMANMSIALLKYEKIKTTLAKGKELRKFVEPIITRAKKATVHNRRIIAKKINNKALLIKLFDTIAPRYITRPGGYTRLMHLSVLRAGDNSKMVFIELVSS